LLNKKSRAIHNEDVFQETELDHWKVEVDIARVKRDLAYLGKQRLVVQQ
jgi:hypothetical protein